MTISQTSVTRTSPVIAVSADDPIVSRRTFLDASLAGAVGVMLGSRARATDGAPSTAVLRNAPASDALAFLSIQDASALVRTKKISPVELTQGCLSRIERLNSQLNAFITVTADSALAEARQAEAEIQQGR